MASFPTTTILRHRKENLKKCSLRGLEGRPDLMFRTYPWTAPQPNLERAIVLSFDGPLLSEEDNDHSLFFIDATWRLAKTMYESLKTPFIIRSLPKEIRTAYPRRQEDCIDPDRGLATVEALYVAYTVLGRDPAGLLDHYYWKTQFLLLNRFSSPAKL